MSALAIRDIGLRDEGRDILNGVSLAVQPGQIAVVLGPAASGKSALLRAVAGLETPSAGSIAIGDQVVFDDVNRIDVPAERRGIGFIFQSGALWEDMTAAENVAFCARFQEDRSGAMTRVGEVLAQTGLADLADRRPSQLTAVERARLALARALVCRPRLLLLDDPLAGIEGDDRTAARIWLAQSIRTGGIATLVAVRERADAMALAERVALLNGGTIEQEGTPEELYSQPATPFAAAFMGAGNRIEGTLVEKAGTRAFIDVMGTRLGGVARTHAQVGDKATAMIRSERVLLGGGPGANRLGMTLAAQTYVGERWELTFVKETITVRAHTTTPLRYHFYHLEFPPDALWIY